MKNKITLSSVLAGVLFTTMLAFAAPKAAKANADQNIPPFPVILVNAQFVYVTSYDGDEFLNTNLLPEDLKAISTVQDEMKKWGKFIVVYEPSQADIVIMVTSRPSEDILAVYDAKGWPRNGQYLWRMTSRGGLQQGEVPLVTNLEKAFEKATTK